MDKVFVGIDPDLDKSGVAVWSSVHKNLKITTMTFPLLVESLRTIKMRPLNYHVVLEAGWLNRVSNFHKQWKGDPSISERIAKNVGENHAVGKLIEQFLKEYKIPYELVKPSTAKWGPETFKKITGLNLRTNSEMRDAAKLVYGK